ncbi:hypothetical protein [Paenibacillus tepidiphilus]|uniref:hypothetical protein n=1 Tax=Paenibacillus tepidiphilus TaxID=2608683 RepID=UPI00123BE80D|nr:hypothetical protein [Paenibacillus tepidiphilus]
MKTRIDKKNSLLLIYIYAFFVIYMPELKEVLGIRSHYILGLGVIFILLLLLKGNFKINKKIFTLCLGIMVASMFFSIRAYISGNEMRILQNNFIIIQIIHINFIVYLLKKKSYTQEKAIIFLLNLGLVQGIMCIIMLFVPGFRDIALELYYNGREENVFISANRIYGISGDYTFFTPVFHGILAVLACIYAMLKNYRFLYYVPFLLIAILLNGRTGLIVFAVGFICTVILLLLRGRSIGKILSYVVIFVIVVFLIILIIKVASPNTYNWIIGGIEDSLALLITNEYSGNYEVLLNTMLYWPKGLGIIWGEGYRVFGENGPIHGKRPSDIGYVNDMFMGGIIYITILYSCILSFLLKIGKKMKDSNKLIESLMSISLVLILLLSNYKGESMKSGAILLGAVFIKLILMEFEEKKGSC